MRIPLLAVLPLPLALAHMELKNPFPFRSKFDPAVPDSAKDYSMTNPLSSDGSNFPCKGYQNDPSAHTTATYTADGTTAYPLELSGSTLHEGGSCQVSLSYDNAASFRVLKSWMGNCPPVANAKLNFTVPGYAPNGTAILAWTWQNKVGNREFYMNCAQVEIASTAPPDTPQPPPPNTTQEKIFRSRIMKRHDLPHPHSRTPPRHSHHPPHHAALKRQDPSPPPPATNETAPTSWPLTPFLWKANLPTVTNCTTTEGEDPRYPHPGNEVVFGGNLTESSPVTPGNCDDAGPPGPTVKQG